MSAKEVGKLQNALERFEQATSAEQADRELSAAFTASKAARASNTPIPPHTQRKLQAAIQKNMPNRKG